MADFAELNQQINVSLNDKNASAGYKRISDSAEKARIAAKTAAHEMTKGFDAASMAAQRFGQTAGQASDTLHQKLSRIGKAAQEQSTVFGRLKEVMLHHDKSYTQYLNYVQQSLAARLAGLWAVLRYIRTANEAMEKMSVLSASYNRIMGADYGPVGAQFATSEMMKDAIAVAYKYGASIKEVAGTMIEFARQGRSAADIKYLTYNLAELRLLLATSTGEFMSMGKAMETATVLMNQMDVSVFKAVEGLKLIAEYDIRTATGFEQISTALTRFASAGKVAGMTMEEMIQAATAFTEIGITGERAGTALNSILARIGRDEKSINYLKSMGAEMIVLKDGTYQTASSMEMLLSAYRKVMASGNFKAIRQFGDLFAGMRLQSTLFAGLARLDKQTRAQVDVPTFNNLADQFQKDLQNKLNDTQVNSSIKVRVRTGEVSLSGPEVKAKIQSGIDDLVRSLKSTFTTNQQINLPDNVSLAQKWFGVSTQSAVAIVDQYRDLFKQIEGTVSEFSSKVESPYARYARMAQANDEKSRAERERAIQTMTDTITMTQSRLKTVFESVFLTQDFSEVFKGALENMIPVAATTAKIVIDTIRDGLNVAGLFMGVEQGIKNIGYLIQVYFGVKTISTIRSVVQYGLAAFGSLIIEVGKTLDKMRYVAAGGHFSFSESSTIKEMQNRLVDLNRSTGNAAIYQDALKGFSFSKKQLNEQLKSLKDIRVAQKEASQGFKEMQSSANVDSAKFNAVAANMGSASKEAKLLNGELVNINANSNNAVRSMMSFQVVDGRLTAVMNTAHKTAAGIEAIGQSAKSSVLGIASLKNAVQGMVTKVSGVTPITPTPTIPALTPNVENMAIFKEQMTKVWNIKNAIREMRDEARKALSAPGISDAMTRQLEEQLRGLREAKTATIQYGMSLVSAMRNGGNVTEEMKTRITSLGNAFQQVRDPLKGLDTVSQSVFGSIASGVTSVVTKVATFIGVLSAIYTTIKLIQTVGGWFTDWLAKIKMRAQEASDELERLRQTNSALQKQIEGYYQDREATENVLSKMHDQIMLASGNQAGLELASSLIVNLVPDKLKNKDNLKSTLRDIFDEYRKYVEEYPIEVDKAIQENREAPQLLSVAEFVAQKLDVATESRAAFIDIFRRYLETQKYEDAKMTEAVQSNVIKDSGNKAQVKLDIKDSEQQFAAANETLKSQIDTVMKEMHSQFNYMFGPGGSMLSWLLGKGGMFPGRDPLVKEIDASPSLKESLMKFLESRKEEQDIKKASTEALVDWLKSMVTADEKTGELNYNQAMAVLNMLERVSKATNGEDSVSYKMVQQAQETLRQAQEAAEAKIKNEAAADALQATVRATNTTQTALSRLQREAEALQERQRTIETEIANLKLKREELKSKGDKEGANQVTNQINDLIKSQIEDMKKHQENVTKAYVDALSTQEQEVLKALAAPEIQQIMDERLKGIADVQQRVEEERKAQAEIDQVLTDLAKTLATAAMELQQAGGDKKAVDAATQKMNAALDQLVATASQINAKLGEALGRFLGRLSAQYAGKLEVAASQITATAKENFKTYFPDLYSGLDHMLEDIGNKKNQATTRIKGPAPIKTPKARGGGGGGRDLLAQLADEHAQRMAALEISFRTIKDSEGKIIEYLDRTGTVDYMRAQIEEIKKYEAELAKAMGRMKNSKEKARLNRLLEQEALKRVELEWQIKLKLNEASKMELENDINGIKNMMEPGAGYLGMSQMNQYYDQIFAKERELHNLRMEEAKGDPLKQRTEEIRYQNTLLAEQRKLIGEINKDFSAKQDVKMHRNPLEKYDTQFRQENASLFYGSVNRVQNSLDSLNDTFKKGASNMQSSLGELSGMMAQQRQRIMQDQSLTDQSRTALLNDIKKNAVDEFKKIVDRSYAEASDALASFNMSDIAAGQKFKSPTTGLRVGTSLRDRARWLEAAKKVLDEEREKAIQWFREQGYSDQEIAESTEIQQAVQAAVDKKAEQLKKELEIMDKAREMMRNEIKNALISGWEEGFNIGIEHGFSAEGYKALAKAIKMNIARGVSHAIQKLIADQLTDAMMHFFNETLDGVGSIMGKSIGGLIAPIVSNIVGTIIGFLIGGLFHDFVKDMEEEQAKQQRDAVSAQGFSWSYQDPEKATPYYEFNPPVTSETVKILKFNTTFNITTDAALAMAAHRRELERVVTTLFTEWVRTASKTVGSTP